MSTMHTVKTNPRQERDVEKSSSRAAKLAASLNSRVGSAVAIVIAALWTIPTLGLFISSFRPEREIKTTGWWSFFANPSLTLENYGDVLFSKGASSGQLASYFVNSLVITIPAVIFPLVLATMAAYVLAWTDFRGRNWIYIGIFALQIVPLQMALVPLLSFFSQGFSLGGVQLIPPLTADGSTFISVWFAHTCFALPFGVFLIHNFMSELPRDIMESARVDGASSIDIFWRIVLPLVGPVLATFAIFQFLWVWNDLLIGLVFAGDTPPITVRLAEMAGTRGNEWQRLTAGAFVSMIIPLIVFLSLQKYFVRGLLAGSVKG